jgi:transposase-like protein
MGKGIKGNVRAQELEPVSLSELIHRHVRAAIDTAVHEELRAALGTSPYERRDVRRGYRNGARERTLTGPTGPVALTLPRAILFSGAGDAKEWTSSIIPRYQRRSRRSMKLWSLRTWQAATPAGFAARSSRCSRRPRSPRVRCRAWWPR